MYIIVQSMYQTCSKNTIEFQLVSIIVCEIQNSVMQVVKIADFGIARMQLQSGVMTAETGTYRWMAPEVLSDFNRVEVA